jgi:hypothetical protein
MIMTRAAAVPGAPPRMRNRRRVHDPDAAKLNFAPESRTVGPNLAR